MNRPASVLRILESATGVSPRDGERYSEYVERLDDEFVFSTPDRARLDEIARKELFARDSELSDADRRELVELCNRLTSRDRSNRTTAISSETTDSVSASETEPGDGTGDLEETPTDGVTDSDSSPDSRSTVELESTTHSSAEHQRSAPDQRDDRGYLSRLSSYSGLTASDFVYLFPLIAGAAFVFFYGLGSYTLQTWDEGFYANMARHMVQDGYWLVPHMYFRIGELTASFEPWLRLPPLGIWLQAIAMLAFGVNEFAVRLPSASAGLLTTVVVYFLGRSFASRRAGFLAGMVYLTVPYMHSGFNGGRDGGLETMLVLFGSLFIYTTWLAVKHENPRWLYPMGFFAGLAVMTKGFGAGVFLLVVLPLVFFRQQVFLSREMVGATGITALVSVPWPTYVYSLYGDVFVEQFFVRYVFDRAIGGAFGTNTNTLFSFMNYPYIKELLFSPELFHPWSFMLLFGLPVIVYRELSADDSGPDLDTGLFVWWMLASFGLFVFIGNKVWYIMPMFVPAAVLLGREADAAIAGRESDLVPIALGAVIIVAVSPGYSTLFEPSTFLGKGAVMILGVVSIAWFAPVHRKFATSNRSRLFAVLSKLAPLVVALLLIGVLVGMPPMTEGNPEQKALADEVNRIAPPSEAVFIETGMGIPFHTFSFYAQRPLESGTVTEFQTSDTRYAILREESVPRVQPSATVLMNATVWSRQDVSLVEVER